MLDLRTSSRVAFLALGALAVGCGGDDSDKGHPQADASVKFDGSVGPLDGGLDAQTSQGDAGTSGQCPAPYECNSPTGLFLCTKQGGEIATCEKQSDCAFGQCYAFSGQGICLQQCIPSGGLPTSNTIKGVVVELQPGKGQTGASETAKEPPLTGVQVCVVSPDIVKNAVQCATTAADGTFTLSNVPPNRNAASPTPVAISFTKSGYLSQLQGLTLFDGPQVISNDVRLLTTAYAQQIADKAGTTLPDQTTGWLQTEALEFNPPANTPFTYHNGSLALATVPGVVVSSSPDAGVGPVYVDNGEQPLAPLAGGLDGGVGTSNVGTAYFTGAAAGSKYQITFKHPTLSCGDTPTAATVVPGFLFANIATVCGKGVSN